jgi:iron complex transport system substrate-binding protein
MVMAVAEAGAQHYPVAVTDSLSRTVVLRARPERIISLSPANTEILFAVGAGDRVIGVTSFCNYPPAAMGREKVGGFLAETISIEKIVALAPDLVVSDGAIHRELVAALEKIGLTVYAKEPVSFEDTCAAIMDIGRLTGNAANAADVALGMNMRLHAVQDRIKSVPEAGRPAVFWEVFDEPLMTAGKGAFVDELITLAGGKNVFGNLDTMWPQVSAEQVIRADPAVIMGADDHGDRLTVEQVRMRAGWGRIDAVASGRIYLVDADVVSRAGPRLAEGVEAIARALYPGLF